MNHFLNDADKALTTKLTDLLLITINEISGMTANSAVDESLTKLTPPSPQIDLN